MALFRAKFACILAIRNPIFRWESCKGSVWESVKNYSSVCKKAGTRAGSRGWLTTVSRQIDAHVPSMPEAKASRQLFTTGKKSQAGQAICSWLELANSQLNPIARSSCQNILFGKIWLFTFLLTLLYIYPYIHDSKRASRENFERETLEKTRLTHSQSLPKRLFKFLYSLPLHCQILERLITKTFSHHIYFCERVVWCFGKQLRKNQFHIGWCYGQVVEFRKLEKK